MKRPARVVVAGGGVIGCAVAYYAARRGLRVTLVDRPRRGRATSASAGGLWPLGESLGLGCGVIFFKTLIEQGRARPGEVGPPPLPRAFLDFSLASNALHRDLAEDLRRTAGIDAEHDTTSLLFVLYDRADDRFARSLLERCPAERGRMQWVSRDELRRCEPRLTPDNAGALRFLGDDQVNPYLLAEALRAGAARLGAEVRTHTEVTRLLAHGQRVTGVQTAVGPIEADVVVNAAGAWAPELAATIGVELPVHPVRGQIVCTETLPPGTLSACVSTSDCYLAQKRHGEIIVGSTTEEVGFDAGVTPEAIRELCRGAVRCLPLLRDVRVKRVWSGFRPGSPDELPILGPADGWDGYLNAAGHFRTGILTAPLTGKVLAEWIAGDAPSFPIEPFLLARFAAGGAAAEAVAAGGANRARA